MPREAPAPPQGLADLLRAIRDPSRSLRETYKGDPVGLAKRFHLKLPEKPAQTMIDLGILTREQAVEKFGENAVAPGLKALVEDVCTGRTRSAVAVANRGGGKVVTLNTPLPTPTGWTTMGEVQVGDWVLAADGTPTPVVWKSEIEDHHDCYEIVFDDGQKVTAGAPHEWLTEDAAYRRWRNVRRHSPPLTNRPAWNRIERKPEVRTTEEIFNTLYDPGEKRKQSPNHTIRNASGLKLPPVLLPVDPYVLGYWLGDGTKNTEFLTIGTQDLDAAITLIEQCGYEVSIRDTREGCKRVRVYGLKEQLYRAGCLSQKHIPEIYMRASEAQREALLQGLMDTDGTTRAGNANSQFTQKNERLLMQVAELVASLGMKYRITTKHARCQTGAEYDHLLLNFNPNRQIYRLPRKAARVTLERMQAARADVRYIVDVRPVSRVPLQCIQVAHPDHLYLVGEGMIPTHNSMGVSFIEFYLVFMEDYDALNLGGSELQADQVYQYIVSYIEAEPEFQALVKGDPLQSKTETHNNAWIRVLTASQKSVRSPHAGGRKKDGRMAGGLLVIDEEAEAAPDIVEAALPTINTARPSVNVRCSTFHNAEGTFAELIDNHVEMGYDIYKWDIFDVAEPCECPPDKCENPEPCFRNDHSEEYVDPDDGQRKTRMIHKAYCGGRARYADGWIPVVEIETLFRRMKRNHSRWEVEAMGLRPSTSGFVLKDPVAFARNRKKDDLYVPGWPVTVCIDWGTIAAGLTVWQEQPGDRHALIESEQILEAGQTQIIGAILGMRAKYEREFLEVAADIGGGGNYLNPLLREQYRVPTRDVNFAEEKEAAVAAWNIFNEAGKAIYIDDAPDFHAQAKSWKRKQGRIAKGNDHLMDSSVCYFAKFIDRLGLTNVRIAPRSFSAGVELPQRGTQSSTPMTAGRGATPVMRPIMRSFGGSRR